MQGRRKLTGGAGLSAGRERGEVYRFGEQVSGPRASFRPGPEWFPEAFSIFFLFFFLSISVFLFLL
jgi:hypothetical protein